MREEYKEKKKEFKAKLEKKAEDFLYSEYRKIMGENYGTLEELWKVFERIEEAYYANIDLPTRGEILQRFEKEKLNLMVERVVKNINTQNLMLVQSKEIELDNMRAVMVILMPASIESKRRRQASRERKRTHQHQRKTPVKSKV